MVDTAPIVPRDQPDDPFGAASVVADNNPDDFGYPTVVNGVVILPAVSATAIAMVKANGTTKAKQLVDYSNHRKAKAGELPPPTEDVSKGLAHVNVVASPTTRSVNQMLAFNDEVFDFATNPQFADAEVVWSGIDGNSKVLLTVHSLTDSLAAALAERFGTDSIEVQESPDLVLSAVAGNRNQDAAPYKGGALIYAPGGSCSSGFIWSISASQKGMLTAGHCIPDGGTVFTPIAGSVPGTGVAIGSVPANWSQVNWTKGTGTHYLTGQSAYLGDLALVTLSASPTMASPTIYRGGPGSSTTATVGEMWSRSTQRGDQYCTGGVVTGELCGWTVTAVGTDTTYAGNEGIARHVTIGTRSGSGIIEGDSGGPVYTVRADGKIAAKGIIEGGGSASLPGLTISTSIFTDIWDAFYAFPGTLATDVGWTPIRVGGADRYSTAAAISQNSWPSGSSTAYLASGLNFPDALAGVPLAAANNAPILLTDTDTVPTATMNELKRLGAKTVILLGGTGAISSTAQAQLQIAGYAIQRISGDDRYQTAAMIGGQVAGKTKPTTAVITTGTGFADALSISPVAGMFGWPMLFTTATDLPAASATIIQLYKIKAVVIVGGTDAVGAGVETQLRALGVTGVIRISGADRYATSASVATSYRTYFMNGISAATGTNFPDALVGGVLSSKLKVPMLLLDPSTGADAAERTYAKTLPGPTVYEYGATTALPDAAVATLLN